MNERHVWLLGALALMLFPLAAAGQLLPGSVDETYELPLAAPTGLAWDGTFFWAADRFTATIARIHPESGRVVERLEAPGHEPMGLAWDGERLWCVDAADKTAYALLPNEGLTVKALELETPSPQGIGWDGEGLWISDGRAGELIRIDGQDGTTVRTLSLPTARMKGRSEVIGIAFSEGRIWLSERAHDTIFAVDRESGEVLDYFDAPGPYPAGLAWDGDHLWCLDYERRALDKVNVLCGGAYTIDGAKKEHVVYQERWRNYGPGTVKTLDIYLAVPGDLPNQKILDPPRFEPHPTEFLLDPWGQNVAHFRFEDVGPGEEAGAVMEVDAEIRRVRWRIEPDLAGTLDEIPPEIAAQFLADETKLALDSQVIRKAVREAVGDERNAYRVALDIYRYIQDRMHYELSGGWNVAPTVLERGSGSCSEYTFVMIAMCRAAGLPARYQGSVVIRGDDASRDDVFHRWVEVFLPNYGWIPVDPSGGDSDTPWVRARYFGELNSRFLITTVGGGASPYLGWNYNSDASWTAEGRVELKTFRHGDWSPVDKTYEPGLEDAFVGGRGGTGIGP